MCEEEILIGNRIAATVLPMLKYTESASSIKDMSLDVLLMVYCSGKICFEKNLCKQLEKQEDKKTFEENLNLVKTEIVSKIKDGSKIYVLFDKKTKMPFVDEYKNIYAFTSKQRADNVLAYYKAKQNCTWTVKEIKRNKIEAFLNTIFHNAANNMTLNLFGYSVDLKRSDFLESEHVDLTDLSSCVA